MSFDGAAQRSAARSNPVIVAGCPTWEAFFVPGARSASKPLRPRKAFPRLVRIRLTLR
jgi:hypothetical protein